jgi:hypothetical protein
LRQTSFGRFKSNICQQRCVPLNPDSIETDPVQCKRVAHQKQSCPLSLKIPARFHSTLWSELSVLFTSCSWFETSCREIDCIEKLNQNHCVAGACIAHEV